MERVSGACRVLAVVVLLGACAADPDDSVRASRSAEASGSAGPAAPSDGATSATGDRASVKVLDNNFLPQSLSVAVGTEVVFENNGRNDHDVTPVADLERVRWGVPAAAFAPTDTYSYVFTQPGTYEYYCTIHGTATAGMIGSIVVTEP